MAKKIDDALAAKILSLIASLITVIINWIDSDKD